MKKTTKERKQEELDQERIKQGTYERYINSPQKKTWSARMPAYAFTVACPNPMYRPGWGGEASGKEANKDNQEVAG